MPDRSGFEPLSREELQGMKDPGFAYIEACRLSALHYLARVEELEREAMHDDEHRGQLAERLKTAEERVRELREALDRAVYLGQHLWQMIPQDVWRASGAEAMGQYEGDYRAEQVRDELAALASVPPEPVAEEKP